MEETIKRMNFTRYLTLVRCPCTQTVPGFWWSQTKSYYFRGGDRMPSALDFDQQYIDYDWSRTLGECPPSSRQDSLTTEKTTAPDFDKLTACFLGKPLSLPALDHPEKAQPKIERYVVDKTVSQKCGPRRKATITRNITCVWGGTFSNQISNAEQTKFHNVNHWQPRITNGLNIAYSPDPPSLRTWNEKGKVMKVEHSKCG